MLANDISQLLERPDGLINIDTFRVTMFNTLEKAIDARDKAFKSIEEAKECQRVMIIILEDLNHYGGNSFLSVASILFGWMRKNGRRFVTKESKHVEEYTFLCAKAIQELRDEEGAD